MKNVIEESNPGAHMVFELPHREECSINREFCDYYVIDCPFPDCCHVCTEAMSRSAELHAKGMKMYG